jgi:hypothetical protein
MTTYSIYLAYTHLKLFATFRCRSNNCLDMVRYIPSQQTSRSKISGDSQHRSTQECDNNVSINAVCDKMVVLKHSCLILTLYFLFKTPGALERVTQEHGIGMGMVFFSYKFGYLIYKVALSSIRLGAGMQRLT